MATAALIVSVGEGVGGVEPLSIERTAALLGIPPRTQKEAARLSADLEARLGRRLPEAVRVLLAYDGLAEALGRTYESEPMLHRGVLVPPEDMPGVDGDVLWLMSENQGVSVWGVPLDAGDDPPVLVGRDLAGSKSPTRDADTLEAFLFTLAWDSRLLARRPLLEAETVPLDDDTEAYLAAHLERHVTTWGWPCHRNLRFESPTGVGLLLWPGAESCDWRISGPDAHAVELCVRELLYRPDLRDGYWSTYDTAGSALFDRLRASGVPVPEHIEDRS